MKKYPASLVLGVYILVGVASVQATDAAKDAIKHGTLQVGMDPTHMSFEMTSKRGQIIDFRVNLLRAMARSIDVKLELISTSYDSIIPVPLTDRFGMVGSGMALTQECSLRLNFSEPFIVIGQTLLVRKELEGKIKSCKDLNDPQYGTTPKVNATGEIVARKLISKAKYHSFDNESGVVMDVVNDKVDAFICDSLYNMVTVSKFGAGKLVYLNRPSTYKPLAFGLKKGNYDSISFINNFPHQVRKDDTYQCAHDKWFKNTKRLKEIE